MDDDDILSILNSYSDYVIQDLDKTLDVASLDYESRKRLSAVIQIQHLMKQYRLGHPMEVVLYRESDYIDYKKTEKFYSPQHFASLCKAAGKPVSIKSLIEIYDSSEEINKEDFPSILHNLLNLLSVAHYFERYKEREFLVDFDDLLLLTYEYARNNRDNIKKYRWIQIDEVQDLNPLQFAIVDLFTDVDNVTIYLGDEQQAIFSFIGAKLETLDYLKKRCGENLHHLDKCYRSPKYLLDVFNHYANHILDTDPDFLPKPNNFDTPNYGDLRVHYSESNITAYSNIVDIVKENHDGRTAIIVPSNDDANKISNKLGDIPHFKISGTDLFSTNEIKLLLSHLNVINNEINFLAWARIFWLLGLFKKYSQSREFVYKLRVAGLNPTDFLNYDKSSYILEFEKIYSSSQPIVIFDTETTGLDVFSDDIVQIAALKIVDNKIVDKFDVLMHTDKEIPQFLGGKPNPLVEKYSSQEHLSRRYGISKFFDFAKGSILIGHNVEYDYNILINNCKRDTPNLCVRTVFPLYFDTLKISRILFPKLKSYKLKDLLTTFVLEGNNSHLADDDIIATKSVVDYCFSQIQTKKENIVNILNEYYDLSQKFKSLYGQYYSEAKRNLYKRNDSDVPAIVSELQNLYKYFIEIGIIKSVEKFKHICKFLTLEVIDTDSEKSLYEQLNNHIMDVNTYKEADLCDDSINSSIVKEKVFVSTVHKAKGLEFENVIVFVCVDGVYPFFASDDEIARKEDARKLYVAMSRAKRRLCFHSFNKRMGISQWGNHFCFDTYISPYLSDILKTYSFLTT